MKRSNDDGFFCTKEMDLRGWGEIKRPSLGEIENHYGNLYLKSDDVVLYRDAFDLCASAGHELQANGNGWR